jgi:hypothetical protein
MTVSLTKDEIEFLSRHNLSEHDVLDCRRIPSKNRRSAIKTAGKVVALGAPCQKFGHRIRSRAGHCVQCDTGKLAYQARKTAVSKLYLAGSKSRRLIKVGISNTPSTRMEVLRNEGYASATDWVLLMVLEIRNAGKAEKDIQRKLSPFRCEDSYQKGTHTQSATEAFCCSYDVAENALKACLPERELVPNGYQFRAASRLEYSFT